jgi:Mg2+-importing ATPase
VAPTGKPASALKRLGLPASELSFAHGTTPLGNALDLAVWRALDPSVARAELEADDRLAVLPFTFERRRVSVVLDERRGRRLLCKGAAEEVLARCDSASAEAQATL